jgi:hypothetical protein
VRGTVNDLVGALPYRLALAGGWIDQPFVSSSNPGAPGSMVVVAVEPRFRFMDACGMGTSTRKVAQKLWGGILPSRPPAELVRELYAEENRGRADPSGSQDMVGLVYPGVTRIDYDAACEGGIFPARVESNFDPGVALWIAERIKILPVAPRPAGYSPLDIRHIEPGWVKRLGDSGRACFDSIVTRDLSGLQASMNECMCCWEALLPGTVRHKTISVDLKGILAANQGEYGGAMYSGCGGGYLYVATERQVPGSFQITVRLGSGE